MIIWIEKNYEYDRDKDRSLWRKKFPGDGAKPTIFSEWED